jgi:hypothetical protein
MKYDKPTVVLVANALQAIQSCEKCSQPPDGGHIAVSTSAYEADE